MPSEPGAQQRRHFLAWVKKASQGLMLLLLRWMMLWLRWMMWRSHFLLEIGAPVVVEQMLTATLMTIVCDTDWHGQPRGRRGRRWQRLAGLGSPPKVL